MPFSSNRVRRSSNTVGGAWTVSVTPQADPWTERNRPPHVPVCFPGQFKPSKTLDTKNRAVRLASLAVAFLPESASAQLLFSFLLTRNKGISLAISCNSALHSFTCNPLHLAARTRGATSKGTGSCLPCPTNLTCGLILFLCRLWISLNWPPHASYATVFYPPNNAPAKDRKDRDESERFSDFM